MKSDVVLELVSDQKAALWNHLLSQKPQLEEAAFLFVVDAASSGEKKVFRGVDWFPVSSGGFVSRSEAHMELTDKTKATVIKRAHDLGACLVEFHSHTGPWPAAFSYSDMLGFREFVPHVRWRLKGKPYFAVVVTETGFDALVWMTESVSPIRLHGIQAGDEIYQPSKFSRL
jgi:hypothetical protein